MSSSSDSAGVQPLPVDTPSSFSNVGPSPGEDDLSAELAALDAQAGLGQDLVDDREALQPLLASFQMPEGFTRDIAPTWTPHRSVIFDYGVKCTQESGRVVWLCMASSQCCQKSARGVGIAIKGAVTNCTNHLRDLHKVVSKRSVKLKRKPEDIGYNPPPPYTTPLHTPTPFPLPAPPPHPLPTAVF
ncbi:hypothetical protein B484DRAFT_446025 [Ochromonadaceae sp. CCMP2298]|nr:hypothetical protein B484DRAFT_446025 [Ochromonadaceae sp. CCMP2298]